MSPILEALGMGIVSLTKVIFHPIFWVVLFLVSTQYKRQIESERKMLGIVREGILGKTINSTLYGLLGGLIGSIMMIAIGVSIRQEGLLYIWPIAILLFMVKSRYLCFSYAGGILALFSLIFGFPSLDIPGLMALVAILHFVESFLIYTNGNKDSIPIVIDKGEGQHFGGYSLQRFWPIPIVVMTILLRNQVDPITQIQMPNWWPLIKPMAGFQSLEEITFIMVSLVAALGYGDIALTQPPKSKVRKSAAKLGIYSVILLILSILSSRIVLFQWVAALFAPIAHELIIIQGRREEREGIPLFTLPKRGIRVLEVLEGSASDRMDIQRGDIIYSMNNIPVNSEEDITEFLRQCPTYVWVDGESYKGEKYTKELRVYPYGLRTLGVLLLPEYTDISYSMKERDGLLKRVWMKISHNEPK